MAVFHDIGKTAAPVGDVRAAEIPLHIVRGLDNPGHLRQERCEIRLHLPEPLRLSGSPDRVVAERIGHQLDPLSGRDQERSDLLLSVERIEELRMSLLHFQGVGPRSRGRGRQGIQHFVMADIQALENELFSPGSFQGPGDRRLVGAGNGQGRKGDGHKQSTSFHKRQE